MTTQITITNLRLSFEILCMQCNGEVQPTELTPSAFVAIARRFRNASYPVNPLDADVSADEPAKGVSNALSKNYMLLVPSSGVKLRLYKKLSVECEGDNITVLYKWCNALKECLQSILRTIREFRGVNVKFSEPKINNLIANGALYPCNTFKLYNAIISNLGLFTLNGRDRPTETSTTICLNHRIKGTTHSPSFTISGSSLRVMGCIDPDYLGQIYSQLYTLSKQVAEWSAEENRS